MPPLVGRCPERAALCCADCKDLDASCDPWANNGECENNVEYMIGECVGRLPCRLPPWLFTRAQTRFGWLGFAAGLLHFAGWLFLSLAAASNCPTSLPPAGTKERPGHCIKSW